MSSQTWIQVGAKGTKEIVETKNELKSAQQRNTNNQKDLARQLAYFHVLELEAGALETPSFSMKTALMKIQKAQHSTDHYLDKITELVSDLTCLLAEIQYRDWIQETHIKEWEADIQKQEKKLEDRATEVHELVRRADALFRKCKVDPPSLTVPPTASAPTPAPSTR